MASQPDLIAPELDRAFVRRVGRPEAPLPLKPFGRGVSHAFGMPTAKYSIPDGLELPVGARWLIEQTAEEPWQFFALAGLPPQTEDRLVGFDPKAHTRLADQIAQDAESGRTLRHQHGYNRGAQAADWFAADVISENIDLLNAALDRARVPAAEVYAQGKDGLNALLEDIPTMYVTGLMRRHRHVASQKPIDRNDIMDLAALPSAIVYCDVVVTEVQHAAFARRQGVAERYGTVVLDNLQGLLPMLAAAA